LKRAGHDAVHVREYGLQAASDEQIVVRALVEERIIVSADTDFATLLALRQAAKPPPSCSGAIKDGDRNNRRR
jgi:predicted nuclease of predicted toxin-antitoxin system